MAYFASTGDPLADISEDMAAEQKARAVYENLIDLTTDPDVIGPLLWLRQREIVHFNRFKELFEYYEKMLNNNTSSSNQNMNVNNSSQTNSNSMNFNSQNNATLEQLLMNSNFSDISQGIMRD